MDSPHHRKIELQSPADLTYLLSNVRASAQSKLDSAFPPSAAPKGEEDALRSKVEELVQEYITTTFSLALPSLSINGIDGPTAYPSIAPSTTTDPNPPSTPPDDGNYEPHDPRLAEKLRTLYMQHEQETTRVAEMRRDAPGAAARAYMERLKGEIEAERGVDVDMDLGFEEEDVRLRELGRLERREEVERTWGQGVEGLVSLEKVTGVVGKLERAARAVEVVEGM